VERIAPAAAGESGATSATPHSRWRHSGLESVLSRDDAQKALRSALGASDAMVSGNAAIGLARFDEPRVLPRLVAIARSAERKLPMRGAAIEAMGMLAAHDADDALSELAEEFGRFKGPAKSRYISDLHADLVRAMGGRPGDHHAELLREALAGPTAAVRLEAAKAYLAGRPCPRELVDLTADDAAAVRAAAIRALAASRHEEAQACVMRALSDYDLSVRLAAIEALGILPAAENSDSLRKLTASSSDIIRAAAVKALAARGASDAVIKAAGDPSWRVRSAVAESLVGASSGQRTELGHKLLADASLEVRRSIVRVAAEWPLEEAIPFLLTAVESPSAPTRRLAAERLASLWPASAELSPQASPERLAEEVAHLRRAWEQEHAQSIREVTPHNRHDTAVAPLATIELLPILERLHSASVHDRRAAARELVVKHKERPLADSAMARLRQVMESEADALVWSDVLVVIERDGRAPAAELARIAASHPSADVRRRACAYFGRHASTSAVDLLTNCLSDEDITVQREAVRALAQQPHVADLGPLEGLLTSTDAALVVEAAQALVALGSRSGFQALLRATYHRDPAVRRSAAASLGKMLGENDQSGKRQLAPADQREAMAELVRLLDDKGDVRRAALASLEQIARESSTPADPSQAEPGIRNSTVDARANRWKQWLRSQE
jgi:HEAT repeat protein